MFRNHRALKNAQQKLRSQQQAAAQLEEQRKKEEVCKILFIYIEMIFNTINHTNDILSILHATFDLDRLKGRSGWFPKKFLLILL